MEFTQKQKEVNIQALKQHLNSCLVIAENRLQKAIVKNDNWKINHYQNDIAIIKENLKKAETL